MHWCGNKFQYAKLGEKNEKTRYKFQKESEKSNQKRN